MNETKQGVAGKNCEMHSNNKLKERKRWQSYRGGSRENAKKSEMEFRMEKDRD